MRVIIRVVSCLLVGLWLSSSAIADQSSDEARRHFEAGTNAFNLGEFKTAVEEYKAAYKLRNDPVFLYNIAQAYRLANDFDQALFFYRSYLHNTNNPPNTAEVEERIRVLESQLAERKRLEQPPNTTRNPGEPVAPPAPEPATPTPQPTTPPPAPVVATTTTAPPSNGSPKLRLAGIVTGAVGIAALGAGIGLFVAAREAYDSQVHAAPGTVFDPSAESRARTFQPAGITLMVGGAVLAVGGVTLFVLGRRHGGNERSASAAPVGGAL